MVTFRAVRWLRKPRRGLRLPGLPLCQSHHHAFHIVHDDAPGIKASSFFPSQPTNADTAVGPPRSVSTSDSVPLTVSRGYRHAGGVRHRGAPGGASTLRRQVERTIEGPPLLLRVYAAPPRLRPETSARFHPCSGQTSSRRFDQPRPVPKGACAPGEPAQSGRSRRSKASHF